MRSSKSRSRNKPSRSRTSGAVGNVVNRVFDSSGPEGKVRGTPQQIIEKYNQLARDAQLSNDRVAAENFQQHAEHYLRLLNEAQKEIDAKRDQQERENRERQIERDRQAEKDRERAQQQDTQKDQGASDDPASAPQPDLSRPAEDAAQSDGDSGLVDTPESQQQPAPKRPRKPRRKPEPKSEANPESEAGSGGETKDTPPEAAE